MTRVIQSYTRELKNMKRGPVGTLSALLAGGLVSLGVTAVLVEKTYSQKLEGFLSWASQWLYWYALKRVDTPAGLAKIRDSDVRRLAEFWVDSKEAQSLQSLYVWTAMGSAALGVWVWVWMGNSLAKRSQMMEPVRPGEQALVSAKELGRLIQAAVRCPDRPHTFRASDVVMGKQKIRICQETIGLHLGIGGASQTGKTNAINQLLASRRSGETHLCEKVLIVDPGGEFYARFGKKEDVLLSLLDTRACKWDFWSEGISEEEMARALVEVRDGMDAPSKFFQTTGRAVLTSLFKISGKTQEPLRELWRLANLDASSLQEVLKAHNEISHRYLGQGDSGQSSGVIATSLMNFEFLKYLNHHARAREKQTGVAEKPFSIRQWVLDDSSTQWVFLVATDSHWEQTKPLIRLWFDVASTAILEREAMGKKELVPLWLVCDELSTVGLLPSLPKVLDRGYKYAGRLVLGFQSQAQISQIYGPDATQNILQGLQNVLIFAANESHLAREFSQRLGKSEVEEYESSVTPAQGKHPERVSISTRQRKKESVTEDEIKSLPENHGYLKLARFPPTKVEFAYSKWDSLNEKSSRWSVKPATTWLDECGEESDPKSRPESLPETIPKKRQSWGI
jgi:hypothetical protein